MADHHLPDDPRQWPDDPFQLLGVEPPFSEVDLKRAYTRLIRRFKPEHRPDEFRRIREAYETALQRIQWLRYFPAAESATPDHLVPAAIPTPPGESVSEPATEQEKEAPQQPAVIDPITEAWASAIAGESAEGYSRLVELARSRSDSSDAAIRLYWLLALKPGLDAERSRHDWLAEALSRSRLDGPAGALYRRELAANPKEALFGPYARLLEVADAEPWSVINLARERLAAAGLGDWWARLEGDLGIMVGRQGEFDEGAWLSYLVDVMGYAVFDDNGAIYEWCSTLLADLQHLELSQTWAFDRVDELKSCGRLWRQARLIPEPVRDIVRYTWSGSYRGSRRALELASAWAEDDPAQALYELDRVAGDADGRPFLDTLHRLLEASPPTDTKEYQPALIRGLVRAYLAKGIGKDYTMMRPALLRFLIEEQVDPRELVQACSVDTLYMSRSLAERVSDDGVLWIVWRTATTTEV